ncbi:hypothetical protein SSX86_004002 [Deinandra increscens subsp. villosa]|uniref:Uncharacterized protein n=1 Tax=Deinandra increscens subsp. villosa TaxID=3103831 RepID=A0AAP0H793_9ASTR
MSHSFEDHYTTRSDEEGFGGSFTGNESLSGREQEKLVHANAPAMASQGASGKPLQPKLTLENYLNLEHMDVISALTLRKVDLIDAVRSIELMDAHHSTLQSDVSSNAFLSLNDICLVVHQVVDRGDRSSGHVGHRIPRLLYSVRRGRLITARTSSGTRDEEMPVAGDEEAA